jgi:hypothetical protein
MLPDKDSSDGHWERQCGARTASGKRCTRKPYAGSRYCYLHGGYSPYSGDPATRYQYRKMMALHAIIESNLEGGTARRRGREPMIPDE